MTAPRMILAGEFWNGATARGLAHGFRELGFDVQELSINRHIIQSAALEFKLLNRLTSRRSERLFNREILSVAERLRPDYFFTVKGSYVTVETLEALKRLGVYTINFYPDVVFDHPSLGIERVLCYDVIATSKHFHLPYLEALAARHVIHVDHGYAPLTHRPLDAPGADAPADAYLWDISYVGNASAHKLAWLLVIAEHFAHLRFAVIGHGWKDAARGTRLEPFVIGHSLSGDNFARTVARSRINLAVHFGPVGDMQWEDSVSSRSFHIPASGGFMLHIDSPEIRNLYAVPEEIAVFSDPAELVSRVHYYLAHDAERDAMAAKARQRCVPHYSHDARARAIIDGVRRAS